MFSPLFKVFLLWFCQALFEEAPVYLASKVLETSLPSSDLINSKTFFLAPNLQTQEGLIIRTGKE